MFSKYLFVLISNRWGRSVISSTQLIAIHFPPLRYIISVFSLGRFCPALNFKISHITLHISVNGGQRYTHDRLALKCPRGDIAVYTKSRSNDIPNSGNLYLQPISVSPSKVLMRSVHLDISCISQSVIVRCVCFWVLLGLTSC